MHNPTAAAHMLIPASAPVERPSRELPPLAVAPLFADAPPLVVEDTVEEDVCELVVVADDDVVGTADEDAVAKLRVVMARDAVLYVNWGLLKPPGS